MFYILNMTMDDNLINILNDYWLSEKESKIYITLLRLWPCSASTIARNISENRTTTYSTLKEMLKKWYVSEIEKNNIFQYSIIPPENLLWELEKKFTKFQSALPALKAIMNQNNNETVIQYLQGDDWLSILFTEFANSDTEVKAFAWNRKYNSEILEKKSKYYIKKRTEKNLLYKRIVSSNVIEDLEQTKIKDIKYGRQTAIVNNFLDIKADIDIFWPNKVSFLYFKNQIPQIIIINNKEIFDCLNAIFELIWKKYYKQN